MALDITVIPTETSGSLGGDKKDRFPIPDTDDEMRSAEWNAAKKGVAQATAAIGLGDGSSDGSLEQRSRRALNAPSASGRWCFSDDFGDPPTLLEADDVWQAQVVSGGSGAGPIGADTVPASTRGYGWYSLIVDSTVNASYRLVHRGNTARATMNPILRTRIRTPASFANAKAMVGFDIQAGGATYARAYVSVAGKWVCECGSAAGTGTASVTTATDAIVNTIYEVRIEVDATNLAVRFYVREDGQSSFTLLTTITNVSHANAPPRTTDMMSWFVSIDRVASTGGTMYVDYVEVEGARL